jgi:predicted dehydrogenase
MDYTQSGLAFKIKKTLRYISLYGVKRTLVKIKGQYHMKKQYDAMPPNFLPTQPKQHVGIMGSGNFGFSNIAYYLRKNYGNVIKGAMDINENRAISLFQEYKASYYTKDPAVIINDKDIDLVYIASNHASHAEFAIDALKQGKSVHIEKPHAVTTNQLVRLCTAMQQSKGKVRLGFNRPGSVLGKKIIETLKTQKGAVMLNWFVAGHEIEKDHWYFAPEEGGRILGNLCHWTDLIYQMVNEDKYPLTIVPSRAEKSDCDISVSYVFADGSIATITFSAKGHTFEGVRETLNAHKGNVLIEMKDFQRLRIDNVDKITKIKLFNRDHGHKLAVTNSYNMLNDDNLGESVEYVWNSGYMALMTKEALDSNKTVVVEAFDTSFKTESEKTTV